MSVQSLFDYNAFLEIQNRTLEIYQQPCTIFIPYQYKTVGYEDLTIAQADSTGVPYLGNAWRKFQSVCWLDFAPSKSVFYRFNFFPDDSDELIFGLFAVNSAIREEAFVRTCVPGQVSVWGDMLLKVVSIKDKGMFQTLERVHFLRPYVSEEIHNLTSQLIADREGWE